MPAVSSFAEDESREINDIQVKAWMRSNGYSESDIEELFKKKRTDVNQHSTGEQNDPRYIACNKMIQLFGPGSASAPLVEQLPFLPSEIRNIRFLGDAKKIYQLSAPCGSGKSATMAFLSSVAQSDGCWVLVLLNIANNQAVDGLSDKFFDIYKKMGVGRSMFVVTDDIFLKRNAKNFKKQCDRVADGEQCTWICKADEKAMGKLLDGVPEEAWSRCVVMFDEVHCFFSLLEEKQCKKKSEVNMYKLLYGETLAWKHYAVSNLRVRSVVFSDATDGDLPHVLNRRFKCDTDPLRGDFTRICADHERMKARGYVSVKDFRLFTNEGLEMVQRKDQWFGKDVDTATKGMGLSGREFAEHVTLDHFQPQLLEFCKDAFEVDERGHPKFMLELTSVNKSEGGSNSVEHHAQVRSFFQKKARKKL